MLICCSGAFIEKRLHRRATDEECYELINTTTTTTTKHTTIHTLPLIVPLKYGKDSSRIEMKKKNRTKNFIASKTTRGHFSQQILCLHLVVQLKSRQIVVCNKTAPAQQRFIHHPAEHSKQGTIQKLSLLVRGNHELMAQCLQYTVAMAVVYSAVQARHTNTDIFEQSCYFGDRIHSPSPFCADAQHKNQSNIGQLNNKITIYRSCRVEMETGGEHERLLVSRLIAVLTLIISSGWLLMLCCGVDGLLLSLLLSLIFPPFIYQFNRISNGCRSLDFRLAAFFRQKFARDDCIC